MLQKSENARLAYVLEVLEINDVRFPVAEVSRKTGFKKGQVSGILSGKVPISDSFFNKFKECFPKVPKQSAKQNETTARVDALSAVLIEIYAKVFGVSFAEAMLHVQKIEKEAAIQAADAG